jgi:peroxiredoxin
LSRPLALGLAAAAVAAVLAVLLFAEPPADPIRPGQRAPEFELALLDGGSVSLEALRGKVVLVNFWATWCAPCEAEMPAMERLYAALRGDGFELLAISVDAERDDVEAFRKRLALTFPIALDPDKRAADAYQSHRFPESYLVDRDGTIRARYIGPRDWDAGVYVDHIRRVIAGDANAAAPR